MKLVKLVVVLLTLIALITSCYKGDGLLASNNNVVENDFQVHAEENGYEAFIDYMEREMEEDAFKELMNILDGSYIQHGMHTLKYSSVSGNNEYCFINGKYTIPYNVRLVVKWAKNVEIDVYNDNFKCNRHYIVSNPDEVSYMLVSGYEDGYNLIRIVPDSFEEVPEIEYTEEGFYYLYDSLKNKEQSWFTQIFQEFIITDEFIGNLNNNKENYLAIFEYAENVPGEAGSSIREKIACKELSGGFEKFKSDSSVETPFYAYESGVFVVTQNSRCTVSDFQNIEVVVDEESQQTYYKISSKSENAYLLILTEQGFSLVCIESVEGAK